MSHETPFRNKYLVELSASSEPEPAYFASQAFPQLEPARQFAAMRVATNLNVAQARVIETESQAICYRVDNPLLARADLLSWGGLKLDLDDG